MPPDDFDALEHALAAWFDCDEGELPADLRGRVEAAFSPLRWSELSPEQRRNVSRQLDRADDPALDGERQRWWEQDCRASELEALHREWSMAPAVTVTELVTKEARLREISDELRLLAAQAAAESARYRRSSGRRGAGERAVVLAPVDGGPFIPFPRALKLLHSRLRSGVEEVAAWVFLGEKLGGLRAFVNANELQPPPQFSYAALDHANGLPDFIEPLMGTWYSQPELERFRPTDRFITGRALLGRWAQQQGLRARAFIRAKVRESRLRELHPLVGLTQASCDDASLPDVDETLFYLRDVHTIERDDLGLEEAPDPDAARPSIRNDLQADGSALASEATQPGPPWAPDWANLSPDQRARCILQRKQALKRSGVNAWRKSIAADLGITGRRVSQILDRLAKASPFTALRSDLPRIAVDAPGKHKR